MSGIKEEEGLRLFEKTLKTSFPADVYVAVDGVFQRIHGSAESTSQDEQLSAGGRKSNFKLKTEDQEQSDADADPPMSSRRAFSNSPVQVLILLLIFNNFYLTMVN
jgi:hypothetical protein